MLEKIKENSVVRLKNGQEGTLVSVYPGGYFHIEISDEDGCALDMFDISIDDIAEVIYTPPDEYDDLPDEFIGAGDDVRPNPAFSDWLAKQKKDKDKQ